MTKPKRLFEWVFIEKTETGLKDILLLKKLIEEHDFFIDSAQPLNNGILFTLIKDNEEPKAW